MNLAIIIGISKYENQLNLPACKNDAYYFHELLNSSQKYDDILYIDTNTDSNSVMNAMDDYISSHSNETINEVLLYFSGHGHYSENEFYFCTSNINSLKINSTSISNSNVDRLIRKLSPETYVKIIDACESGSSYIKKLSEREKILQKNHHEFRNCYFFSSSECNQSSYATEFISDFTKSFLENIKKSMIIDKVDIVKYRDIYSALSDEYESNSRQKPFFIAQGTLAEVFLNKTKKLEEFLNNLELNKKEKDNSTLSDTVSIEEVNKVIPTKVDALNIKNEIIKKISTNLSKDICDILKDYEYHHEIINIDVENVFNKCKIGNWLLENKNKFFVFANEKYSRKYHNNPFMNISTMFNDDVEYELSGFQLNVDEKDSIYQIELESKSHLPKYCCQLVFMYSLTKIYLLYDFNYSYPKNWEDYSDFNISDKVNISTIVIKDKSNLDLTISEICKKFQEYCYDNLKKYLEVLFDK